MAAFGGMNLDALAGVYLLLVAFVGVTAALYSIGYLPVHYSEAEGEPREGYPRGTPWSAIPDDWRCPDCGVRDKIDFLPVG